MADTLKLHSFFSSSCGQRVLIAAKLKGLPVEYSPLNISTREWESEEFKKNLNPSGHIPVLEVIKPDGARFILSQSTAILNYFEERFPNKTPLLPPADQPELRAKVRELVDIMVSDCFPPTNSWVSTKVQKIRDSKEDRNEFVQSINNAGFAAFEKLLESSGGKYAVGDTLTLADVCLVPQADVASFYGVEFDQFPRVKALLDRLREIDAFKSSHWTRQIDTPEKLRAKDV